MKHNYIYYMVCDTKLLRCNLWSYMNICKLNRLYVMKSIKRKLFIYKKRTMYHKVHLSYFGLVHKG